MERFESLGFPTHSEEEWKYTNVSPIARTEFIDAAGVRIDPVATREQLRGLFSAHENGSGAAPSPHIFRVVVANGRYSSELSHLPSGKSGLRVMSLEAAMAGEEELQGDPSGSVEFRNHPFSALNTAFLRDGVFVHVPQGGACTDPLHVMSVVGPGSAPLISHPRIVVRVEDGASLTLVESYFGPQGAVYFNNGMTDIRMGQGSRLVHYRLQMESEGAFHVATVQVHLADSSRYESHSVSLGGALTRLDLNVALAAQGAQCELNGLFMESGRQHVDNHTLIDHQQPHGRSSEMYRGVLDGKATGVFNGKIIVRPDAQKTDATQSNPNLLLSDEAKMKTKPQLEIFADDVKCTHGATVGQLDEEAVFYLRSRGVGLEEARSLLTYAFVRGVLDRMKVWPVRAQVEEWIAARLIGGSVLGCPGFSRAASLPHSGHPGGGRA